MRNCLMISTLDSSREGRFFFFFLLKNIQKRSKIYECKKVANKIA